jgi:hypothetical protein
VIYLLGTGKPITFITVYVCSASYTVLCTAYEFTVSVKKGVSGYQEHKWSADRDQCWNFRTIYGARNRVGIRMSYRPAGLYRLAESIPGLLKSLKISPQMFIKRGQIPNAKSIAKGNSKSRL